MNVRFLVPRILQRYANEHTEVRVDGETIQEILADLNRNYPDLYQCICDETGAIRRHINIFVNSDLVCRKTGLHQRLQANDIVSVFQAVSGG